MKIRGAESLPEVRDAGPATVRRTVNDPAASGLEAAAAVNARFGGQVAQGLQGLAAGIDKLAADRDRAKATEALNEYMKRSSELLYDPQSGLMLARGAGAEGLSVRAYEGHKELQSEIGGKLSGRQRRLFAQGIIPYDRDVGSRVMRYEGEAMARYRADEADKLIANTAAAAANDPDGFSWEAQEETVYQATLGRYGDQGAEVNFENSKSVRQALLSQMVLNVAKRDPLKAEAVLNRFSGSGTAGAEVPDFSDRYNTKLSADDEAAFQEWLVSESERQGRDVSKDLFDYDLRGLFKESGGFGGNGHATDRYKKPNHPTFSSGSIYSTGDSVGGEWTEDGGKWSFTPSETNLRMQSAAGLRDYFSRNEPDAALVLNGEGKGADAVFEPAVYEALAAEVERVALPVKAQAFAGDMLRKHGVDGLASAITEVRETYKGKDEDVYLGYVNSLYSDVRQAQHAELESAKLEVQKALYGGGSYSKVAGIIASYSEKFKGYGTQGEAWALGLKVDNDRVHGTGIFAPKPSEALTRTPLTRAEAVRQLVHFNPEFANLPKEEQERLVRQRLGISEEQHSAYFTQLGEAKLRGMSNADLNKAAAMGYITYDEVAQIIEYDKNISPGNKDYLKTKEKNIELFLKNHGGSIFGGTQNPARNTAVFYFREECRKLDPAAPDFYKQADEAGRRAMLRAIEEKHQSGIPLIDEGWIWNSDTELGTLKKIVDGLKIKDTVRDVPSRPWKTSPQEKESEILREGEDEVQDELNALLKLNPKAD